jgi:hypothetical protein
LVGIIVALVHLALMIAFLATTPPASTLRTLYFLLLDGRDADEVDPSVGEDNDDVLQAARDVYVPMMVLGAFSVLQSFMMCVWLKRGAADPHDNACDCLVYSGNGVAVLGGCFATCVLIASEVHANPLVWTFHPLVRNIATSLLPGAVFVSYWCGLETYMLILWCSALRQRRAWTCCKPFCLHIISFTHNPPPPLPRASPLPPQADPAPSEVSTPALVYDSCPVKVVRVSNVQFDFTPHHNPDGGHSLVPFSLGAEGMSIPLRPLPPPLSLVWPNPPRAPLQFEYRDATTPPTPLNQNQPPPSV